MRPALADAYTFTQSAFECVEKARASLHVDAEANAISYIRNAIDALEWAEGVLQKRSVYNDSVSEDRA